MYFCVLKLIKLFGKKWKNTAPIGKKVVKITMGNAVCWLPFFGLAHLYAKISRVPDIRIYEVGISYYERTYYKQGKKITAKDGFMTLWCILKFNCTIRKK